MFRRRRLRGSVLGYVLRRRREGFPAVVIYHNGEVYVFEDFLEPEPDDLE